MKEKIPRKIHYCWFGGKPLSKEAKECIESWKKYMPDYEIIEWNEKNYNIYCCDFLKKAYSNKKWAFVSDYVRLDVIHKYGGIYLDVDVEVIKSFDSLLYLEGFIGFDDDKFLNSGSGIGGIKGNKFIYLNKKTYEKLDFEDYLLNINAISCPRITTQIFEENGGKRDNKAQKILDMNIFSKEYFCPLNFYTGKLNVTSKTYSIHKYSMSWLSLRDKKYHNYEIKLTNILGNKLAKILIILLKTPGTIKIKLKEIGIKGTVNYYISKIINKNGRKI